MIRRTEDHGTKKHTRRTALGAIAGAALVSLAGCTASLLGGDSELERQLDAARETTAKYDDPEQAMADGFVPGGPYVSGMGWHFQHPGRGREAVENGFDVEKPNLLTYVEDEGELELGAIEWGGPVDAVPENPDLFADDTGDASERWHVHEAATHVFALPDGDQTEPGDVPFAERVTNDNWSEFRPPDLDLDPGDEVALHWGALEGRGGQRTKRVADVVATHPDLNTPHAWVHTENPDGVFSPVNPEFGSEHSH